MPLSGKQLIKLFKKHGWDILRIKGSHHIMKKEDSTFVIPVHGNKSVSKGAESKA